MTNALLPVSYTHLADSRLRERDAEFSRKRETLSRAESRIAELDNLFKHLYAVSYTHL